MQKVADGLARVIAVLAAVCIGVLMMATVADVIRRNMTGRALAGTVEYSELLMVSLVFLGLALAQLEKEHVGVNLVTSRLPDRLSRHVRVSGLVVTVVFLAWMTWETGQEAYRSFSSGEVRIGLQAVPVWPARVLIPVGLAALLAQLLSDIVRIARGELEHSSATPSVDTKVQM